MKAPSQSEHGPVEGLLQHQERPDAPDRVDDLRIGGEPPRDHRPAQGEDPCQEHAEADSDHDHPVGDTGGGGEPPFAQKAAHQSLSSDRQRVEGQAEQQPDLHHHLMRRDGRVRDPRRHCAREGEHRQQRTGAHRQVAPDLEKRPQLARIGAARHDAEPVSITPQDQDDEPHRPDPLGGNRRPGRACDPPTGPEDEQRVERQVDGVDPQRHTEGRAGVLEPPIRPVPGAHGQHGGRRQCPDPDVGDGHVSHLAPGSERPDDRSDQGLQHHDGAQSGDSGGPEGEDHRPAGTLAVTGADRPGDESGRPVFEEVEDEEGHREHRHGHPEPGQFCRAEAAHEGGVDERQHRIGDQRAERRNRQRGDLPIVGTAQGVGTPAPDHRGAGVLSG